MPNHGLRTSERPSWPRSSVEEAPNIPSSNSVQQALPLDFRALACCADRRSNTLPHGFRDRWRKGVSNLTVSGCFAAPEMPVLWKPLESSRHVQSQTGEMVDGI